MIYLIIAISTIVFTIWTLFCGSIQIRCNDRDFNIEAKGWNDYTGEYSQIDSISYEENVLQNDNDYRTNGFGNLKYAMGKLQKRYIECCAKVTSKIVPPVLPDLIQILPSCTLTISRTKARPSPTPPSSRLLDLSTRKNGSNTLSLSSFGIPLPVSSTDR